MESEEPQDLAALDNSFLSQLTVYRASLLDVAQKMQSDYDKGVITLSGGALGISLVFLKDVVGSNAWANAGFLLVAWMAWGASILCILASYFTSDQALRTAAEQVDLQLIYLKLAKSPWVTATKVLNAGGGLVFFAGVICLVCFVSHNLPNTKTMSNKTVDMSQRDT
ncbi:MAG: hypothetical protein EOP84_30655, partial [Verrucomicrobiaceae bacterium]